MTDKANLILEINYIQDKLKLVRENISKSYSNEIVNKARHDRHIDNMLAITKDKLSVVIDELFLYSTKLK